MTTTEQAERRELVVARSFNAPREQVWEAFTDPAMVKRWWGPKGFTAPVIESEPKAGGRYLYCMRSPEGKDYWSAGWFKEFSPPERLVAIDSFADREGNIVPASTYGLSGDWPLETEMTITFEEEDGGTRLTMRERDVPGGPDRDASIQGWNESMDKLAEVLKETKKE